MQCPRCEGDLIAYELGDSESLTCEACGYVGVPADHQAEPAVRESWTDAIARTAGEEAARLPLVEAVVRTTAAESDPRDWDQDGAEGPDQGSSRGALLRVPLQAEERALFRTGPPFDATPTEADPDGDETDTESDDDDDPSGSEGAPEKASGEAED